MGKTSIEWCDYTFNPWWGCVKVSDGCKNCYAETFSKRTGNRVWGVNAPRRLFGDKHWAEPLKWNEVAKQAGERHRVFSASMADVFEDRPDLHAERLRLFDLIRQTPNLDWLLLTKRPENIMPAIESALILSNGGDPSNKDYFIEVDGTDPETETGDWLNEWTGGNAPHNVWLGTSIENQKAADERHAILMSVPAVVHFWSAEPLLGLIEPRPLWDKYGAPEWVIAGGESGHGARPMHPDWARSLRDQCEAAGVAFHFKQWGEWRETTQEENLLYPRPNMRLMGDGQERSQAMIRVGKKAAGRLLDGREWNEFPKVAVLQ